VTIVSILSMAALPLARVSIKRQKESSSAGLREMRDAIDRYKDASDRGFVEVKFGSTAIRQICRRCEGRDTTTPSTRSCGFCGGFREIRYGIGMGVALIDKTAPIPTVSADKMFLTFTQGSPPQLDGTKYSDW